MRQNVLKLLGLASIAATAVSISGCKVDELYSIDNIKDVDTSVTLFEDGLSIPLVESTAKIRIDTILSKVGLNESTSEYLKVDENGNYYLSIDGNYSFADMIASLGLADMVKISSVDFSTDFNYEIGDLNASNLKIDGQNIAQNIKLDDFSSSLNVNIDPISQTVNQKAGLASGNYSVTIPATPVDASQVIMNKANLQSAGTAAATLGQSEFDLPLSTVAADMQPMKIAAVSLPEQITAITAIDLKSTAKIRVELSLNNSVLSSGTITPNLTIDLSDVLVLAGDKTSLSLSALSLTKANNYSASADYVVSGVNVAKLLSEKTVTISGNLAFDSPKASATLAKNAAGDLSVTAKISFIDFEVENVSATIKPVETALSNEVEFSVPEIALPEQVKEVRSISFTDASKATIKLSAKNLSKISGLSAKVDLLKVEFPAGLQVSGTGVSNGILTISNADLASGIERTVNITGLTLPAAVNGKINYASKIKINASATASGTISTSTLPKTEADDVEIVAEVKANLALADFDATINAIEQEIKVEKKDISVELPDEIGNFGTFTITPKGSPVLAIDMTIPDLGTINLNAGTGIVIKLPEFVKFASVPAALNFNERDYTLTLNEIKTSHFELPIKNIVATPKEIDGKYMIKSDYYVDGKAGIAESVVNKATVDKVSGSTIAFGVVIPDIEAATISVDELSFDVDQKFGFDILSADSIPEMIAEVSEIKLTDVKAALDLAVTGLPSIGSGKFIVDITAQLPEFINPSKIELKGEIGSDGKFNKVVDITGFDLSGVNFADLRSKGESLRDSITIKGSVYAENPSINLDELNGNIAAKVNAKIADSNDQIGVRSIRAKIDYQIDTLFRMPFFDISSYLPDCNLALPEVTATVDITTNLALPVSAEGTINNDVKLALNFPYCEDPSTPVKGTSVNKVDLNGLLSSGCDSLYLSILGRIDKTRDCYVVTDADYVLDLDYHITAPLALGEEFTIVYADTLDLGSNGAYIAQVLGVASAKLEGKVENTLPLSASIVAEFLAYDEATDTYTKISLGKELKSDIIKANSTSDLVIELAADETVKDLDKITHIRLSADISADGTSLSPSDYIMISNLSLSIPSGITIDPSMFSSEGDNNEE